MEGAASGFCVGGRLGGAVVASGRATYEATYEDRTGNSKTKKSHL